MNAFPRSVPSLGLVALLLAPALLFGQVPDPGVMPGDRVEIDFFTAAGNRLDEVAGTRTVDRNGRLFLPYVGTVRVEGLDAAGIRELLTGRYGEFYANPVVDVTTLLRVNVTGAVRNPGNYFLDPTSTVLDAISMASGMESEVQLGSGREAADPSRVRLVRRGGELFILDLRPATATEGTLSLLVRSGDWIDVPVRTRSRVRDNIQFAGSIASVVATVVGIIVLATN